jgi:twitching motility protein PilT
MYKHTIDELLKLVLDRNGSDLHLVVGCPPRMRRFGSLEDLTDGILTSEDTAELVFAMLTITEKDALRSEREIDFAYSPRGLSRFRVNACFDRDSLMAACRVIPATPVPLESLGFPKIVSELTEHPRGFVLCTGPAGSGKTTTLASMVDYINRTQAKRIITIEDPIEYMHESKMSTISQREVGRDTLAFRNALRSAMRQDPNVLLVGEMRDLETMSLALTAAETGQLVFATMHTLSASEAINRVVDAFPHEQQEQIRVQLMGTLDAVLTQQLVPRADGDGRVAAVEILIGTPAVRNLIREGKVAQLESSIQTGASQGMQMLEKHLAALVRAKTVTLDAALAKSRRPDDLKRLLASGAAAG